MKTLNLRVFLSSRLVNVSGGAGVGALADRLEIVAQMLRHGAVSGSFQPGPSNGVPDSFDLTVHEPEADDGGL